MNTYVFLWDELGNYNLGLEFDPNIHKLSVINFSKGNTPEEAFYNLLRGNTHLFETDIDQVICFQLDKYYTGSSKTFKSKLG